MIELTFQDFPAGADGGSPPLLVAHGLFGSSRNWSALARSLAQGRRVLAVDLRNHGASPWHDRHDYPALAEDLAGLIGREAAGRADVLGHSMGGKAAMALALTAPEAVGRLIVADIAPVAYDHSHDGIVAAMRSVDLGALRRRSDAEPMLAASVPEPPLRSFLLQNLAFEDGRARWRINLDALAANMAALTGWPAGLGPPFAGPTLFLRGGGSPYVAPPTQAAALALFPAARIETLAGAGHWLHAEQPAAFVAAVERFLAG